MAPSIHSETVMEHPIAFIQSSGAHCYDPVRGTVKFSVFHKDDVSQKRERLSTKQTENHESHFAKSGSNLKQNNAQQNNNKESKTQKSCPAVKNDESSQQKKSQAHHANGSENPKNGGKPSELRRKDEEAHQRIQESCKSLVEYKRVESSEDKILQTVGGSRRSREPCVCKDLSNSPKIRSVDPFSGILPSRTGERISQLDHFLIQSTPEIALKQKEGVKFPLTFADLVQWFEEPSFYGIEVTMRLCKDPKNTGQAYFVPYLSALSLSWNSGIQGDKCSDISFIETLPPHQRQPCHTKMLELLQTGSEEGSRLSSSIADASPKSWFAVAWYPIYQIPEGRLRVCFLTYHKLQPVSRATVDESRHETFPVFGMKAYNLDEGWSSDKLTKLDSNARTLIEDPSICHNDYEFFNSRR